MRLHPLLLLVSLVTSVLGAFTVPRALNAPPNFLNNRPSVKITSSGTGYFCGTYTFVNPWRYAATHWSASFVVPNIVSFSWVGESNYTITDNVLRVYASAWGGAEIRAGGNKAISLCVDHSSGDLIPSADAKLLQIVGVQNPPAPVDFSGYRTIPEPDWSNCFPTLSILQEFDVFSIGQLFVSSSSVDGRVASGNMLTVNKLYARLGTTIGGYCNSACSGDNSSASFTAVVENVTWLSPPGLCGGLKSKLTPRLPSYVVDASCSTSLGSLGFNVSAATAEMASLSINLAKKYFTGNVGYSDSTLTLVFYASTGNAAVFFIPGQTLTDNGFTDVEVINPQYITSDTIIIFNVGGRTIQWSLPVWTQLSQISSNVVFNFYEATGVNIKKSQMYGSIVAPYAEVSINTGSTLFGSIYARSVVISESQVYSLGKFTAFTPDMNGQCLRCKSGFFGKSCAACSCEYNYDCDDGASGTGNCTCKAGWDSKCADCDLLHWGPFCNNTCTETCQSRGTCDYGVSGTGQCFGCVANFNGTQCEDCLYGFYGEACDIPCSDTCLVRGVCDSGVRGTGKCSCSEGTGYGGDQCDVCDSGHYGSECQFACSETCVRNGKCDSGYSGTGICIRNSCGALFTGDECESCVQYQFGIDCRSRCKQSCIAYGTCDEGQSGTGSCSNCAYPATGDQCEKCVVAGMYGTNCDKKCECSVNGVCDEGPLGTGKCKCKSGWTGTTCSSRRNAAVNLSGALSALIVVLVTMAFSRIY